ncbi:DUF3592 domain-containing protein [Streptomyces justiciae]|uniref:DUF3592 domain-containing protein n=1 Tax=Streptomyces justiciae TaxID=2780140 RepID=A0ABU3M5B1_9ACTN|nr:DUF3592 domain-containing protein [Streptomyces justiciae]MDT7846696.1 hypothetical protein [Streptomyces justiciae]
MGGIVAWAMALAVVSAGLGVFTTHALRRLRAGLRLRTSGVATAGQCVSMSWRQDEVSVRFSYTLPDGTQYEADSFNMPRTSVSIGDKVPVVYDPASPATAEVTDLLGESIRVHRLFLICITPVLLLFAALDAQLLLALL